MACWNNKPNVYAHGGFIDIPEGEHRVRISKVDVERFSKGRKCFEITLEVSGHHGKLWHHIWYDPKKTEECGKTFYPFFYSFGLNDHDLSHYKSWIGASGAVRVKYERRGYDFEAKYIRFIYGKQRDKLPEWKEAPRDMDLSFLTELPF